MAATPACNAKKRQYKAGFFELHFRSMVTSFDHRHAALVADAAVAAEHALAKSDPATRQCRRPRTTPSEGTDRCPN